MGTDADKRSAVPPQLGSFPLTKKPAGAATGGKASLTRAEYGSFLLILLAQITAAVPAQASRSHGLSLCNSEGHSASVYGQGSHLYLTLCAAGSMRTRPLHSFYVAYKILQFISFFRGACQVLFGNSRLVFSLVVLCQWTKTAYHNKQLMNVSNYLLSNL